MQKQLPNYKLIYEDMINKKFPHMKKICQTILDKNELSYLDVIKLNNIIFGNKKKFNQRLRSYNKVTILEILKYQKENNLNNTELARHFNLSRNSVSKWKIYFSQDFTKR